MSSKGCCLKLFVFWGCFLSLIVYAMFHVEELKLWLAAHEFIAAAGVVLALLALAAWALFAPAGYAPSDDPVSYSSRRRETYEIAPGEFDNDPRYATVVVRSEKHSPDQVWQRLRRAGATSAAWPTQGGRGEPIEIATGDLPRLQRELAKMGLEEARYPGRNGRHPLRPR